MKPEVFPITGTIYSDGSYRDGKFPELGREGWSFAAVDDNGTVVASAYGVPPPWLTGIEGAEAWALFQALLHSVPAECTYWVDCLPLLTAVGKGPAVARDPKNVLARVHGLIHGTLEGDGCEHIGWMPAHLTAKEIGIATRSDGEAVTEVDLRGNALVDSLAKAGAQTHRVPETEVLMWEDLHTRVVDRAVWIGIATQAANEHAAFPYKDSEAARWKADDKARRKLAATSGISGRRRRPRNEQLNPDACNGHQPQVKVLVGSKVWRCGGCKKWARSKLKLCSSPCNNNKEQAWIAGGKVKAKASRHNLCKSGTVLWCSRCGSFAESRAVGLYGECVPPVRTRTTGGKWSQLQRLRAGRHPVHRTILPPATNLQGVPVVSNFGYTRRNGSGGEPRDSNFAAYEPEVFTPKSNTSSDQCGRTARDKARLRRGRILMKQYSLARADRKIRKLARDEELQTLISQFVSDECVGERVQVDQVSDDRACNEQNSDEEFWLSLPLDRQPRDRDAVLANLANSPQRRGVAVGRPSRLQRLNLMG